MGCWLILKVRSKDTLSRSRRTPCAQIPVGDRSPFITPTSAYTAIDKGDIKVEWVSGFSEAPYATPSSSQTSGPRYDAALSSDSLS